MYTCRKYDTVAVRGQAKSADRAEGNDKLSNSPENRTGYEDVIAALDVVVQRHDERSGTKLASYLMLLIVPIYLLPSYHY